ncbi:TIR domain-containing protein [Plantibacter sp. M259]|uniref:TIR domain-containing protein n=1 Tax=Plantibacter sp. M259 TaxID=2583822 RepID=UPI001110DF33|nr:TIR domain-containing protein [Plantibacter sp. M259]
MIELQTYVQSVAPSEEMYERLHRRMMDATADCMRESARKQEEKKDEWHEDYRDFLSNYEKTGVMIYQDIRISQLNRGGRIRGDVPVSADDPRPFKELSSPYESVTVTMSNSYGPSLTLSGLFVLDVQVSASYTQMSYEQTVALLDDIEAILKEYVVLSPPIQPRRLFIGHGGDEQWRILKDRLQDNYKLDVEAFESVPRVGDAINQVLQQVLERCDIGVFVMSAGDTTSEGRKLARQNVVHEIGLFQGRHGWGRAIVVLENGVEEFSNLAGTQQIRFDSGRLADKAGDVALAIERIRAAYGVCVA